MITLTNGEQWSVGASVVEANNIAGVVAMSIDYINNLVNVDLATGTQNGGAMTPSQRGFRARMSINLNNGVVTALGMPTFTLTPTQLANAQAVVKNIRNGLENLATNGLIAGVFTSW